MGLFCCFDVLMFGVLMMLDDASYQTLLYLGWFLLRFSGF